MSVTPITDQPTVIEVLVPGDATVVEVRVPGQRGLQGLQGIQGPKGDTGDQGLQGIQGPKGDTGANGTDGTDGTDGTTLNRPIAALSSSAGVVTIAVTTGAEVYTLALTEDVTSWNFTDLPASGNIAEIRVEITQHASAAKTCVSPASAGRTAGGAWVASSVISAKESLGLSIDSAGTVTLFPSGVYA